MKAKENFQVRRSVGHLKKLSHQVAIARAFCAMYLCHGGITFRSVECLILGTSLGLLNFMTIPCCNASNKESVPIFVEEFLAWAVQE
jgi:ABC-type Co2+ transport system permease subunit